MAQTTRTTPETTAILAVQAAYAAIKNAGRDGVSACTDLMAVEKTLGNIEAFNEAFLAREKFRRLLGQVGIDHAESSLAMNRLFSDAGPVIFGGGGGR